MTTLNFKGLFETLNLYLKKPLYMITLQSLKVNFFHGYILTNVLDDIKILPENPTKYLLSLGHL